MQIYNYGSRKTLLMIIASWLITAALIGGAAIIALSLLSTYVGKDNFPSLTVLVSLIGATVAISQFRSNAQDKKLARARTLAFATQMATEAYKLTWRTLPRDFEGPVDEAALLDPSEIVQRKPHIDEISKVIAALDSREMPSVESMAALVELKSAIKTFSDKIETVPEAPTDFVDQMSRLGLAMQRLGKERDQLYPIYNLGIGVLSSAVERR